MRVTAHNSWLFSANFSRMRSRWGGSTIWKNNKFSRAKKINVHVRGDGFGLYLYGVHRVGGERCMWEGLSWAQQVADVIKVMLVLFDGLDAQTVPGQHCFVTRSVAWWWEEFKISMPASKKKPQPGKNISSSLLHLSNKSWKYKND